MGAMHVRLTSNRETKAYHIWAVPNFQWIFSKKLCSYAIVRVWNVFWGRSFLLVPAEYRMCKDSNDLSILSLKGIILQVLHNVLDRPPHDFGQSESLCICTGSCGRSRWFCWILTKHSSGSQALFAKSEMQNPLDGV